MISEILEHKGLDKFGKTTYIRGDEKGTLAFSRYLCINTFTFIFVLLHINIPLFMSINHTTNNLPKLKQL